MKAVVSAYNFLVLALAVFAGAAIAFAFVLIVVDVGIRAAGLRPPALTSAVVEYILLYFTLFAAPFLTRKMGHPRRHRLHSDEHRRDASLCPGCARTDTGGG